MSQDLYLETRGSVAWLVINRPQKRNAISFEMWQALPDLLERVDRDSGLKALVIRGADSAAFSAGADISEFETLRSTSEGAKAYNAATERAEDVLAGMTKPTIAMVQGVCIGGGCGIAVSCDLRFCDPTATFGITPANLGLVYALSSTKRLVDLVGPSRAKYILFSGRKIDAPRALAIGLADEMFDADAIEGETEAFVDTLVSRAQFSVRSTKRIVRLILAGQAEDNEETRRLRSESFDTDDYREGVRAFLEKRPPAFTYS